jgi:hypothetical protein
MISLPTTLEMNLIAVWQSLHTRRFFTTRTQCCLLWCADEAECDGELLAVVAQQFLLQLVMQNSVEVRDEASLLDLLPHFCSLLVDCIPLWMEYIVFSEDVDFVLYMSPAETCLFLHCFVLLQLPDPCRIIPPPAVPQVRLVTAQEIYTSNGKGRIG